MRNIRRIKAGDLRESPFNHAFTDQEKKVLQIVEQLRATARELKKALTQTPKNACSPPENFDPKEMEEIQEIERSLDTVDLHLRWVPGGAYRYE